MLINFVRAIIIYILVLIVMRLMGKREIGQLQPFELVISIMIADLASIPMTDPGVPIFNGVVPILGLLAMHLLITVLNIKSVNIRKFTCGKPTILIYRGRIDEEALKKERFTVSELQERLRGKDVFNLGDVEFAILETNGEVSVILKPNKRNTTPEDFSIEPDYEGLPYDLIVDGKIMYDNLNKVGKDERWLLKQIVKFKATPDNVLIATMDGKGNFFCQKKERNNQKWKKKQ